MVAATAVAGGALLVRRCFAQRAYSARGDPTQASGAETPMAAAAPQPPPGWGSKRVVICGGGVIGTSIAYHLALRGIKATVVDKKGLAPAASSKAGVCVRVCACAHVYVYVKKGTQSPIPWCWCWC